MFREPNVDRMLRQLPAKQWMEWEAYFSLHPWTLDPELRADWRAASICELVHNANVAKKGDQKPMKAFVLPFEQEQKSKRQQTQAEQFAIVKLITMVHNASLSS